MKTWTDEQIKDENNEITNFHVNFFLPFSRNFHGNAKWRQRYILTNIIEQKQLVEANKYIFRFTYSKNNIE